MIRSIILGMVLGTVVLGLGDALIEWVMPVETDLRAMPSGPGSHASHGAASVSALRVSIPIAGER